MRGIKQTNMDYRAKQQELLNKEEELRNTQKELDNKKNELENARHENEDKKSELIEQLLSEIEALKQNAKDSREQVRLIKQELSSLQEHLDTINNVLDWNKTELTSHASQAAENISSKSENFTNTQTENKNDEPNQENISNSQNSESSEPKETISDNTDVENTTTENSVAENNVLKNNQDNYTENNPSKKNEIQPNNESISSNNSESEIIKNEVDLRSKNWFLLTLNKLLEEIEDTREWISKKWVQSSWKETMNLAKKKLKQYEKQINAKKRALEKQSNPQIFESDISQIITLQSNIDDVRKAVSLWQRWELSNLWAFLYNSPENAKLANNQQEKLNNFMKRIKSEIKQWAILNIFNWHEESAIKFYRNIAEWRYSEADYHIYTANSTIFNPSFQRCGIPIPTWIRTNPEFLKTNANQKVSIDYTNMDRWETFERWWVAWIIDKALSNCNNMTPWQRNTWKSLAVLAGFAGWIFWLYKFYTNKKMGFWSKAGITAAAIFWSQVATWENPISLFNKLMTGWLSKDELGSKFWNAINWVWNSWVESANTIAPSLYSMMIFNTTTKVKDIRTMTNNFRQDNQLRTNFRMEALNKLQDKYWKQSTEHFSAQFSNQFDEQKWNERLASFWVTDSTNENRLIYELANNATMNSIILDKFKSENWLKETENKAKKSELDSYLKEKKERNEALDVTILQSHINDRFTLDDKLSYSNRPQDIQNKEKLVNQVESLSLDPQKKSELKTAVQLFYDERTIETKPNLNDFNLEMDNRFLMVTSNHWQKTEINLDNMTIKWFWSQNGNNYEIRFTKLSDLLNVADLTNNILDRQKNQPISDFPPFQYKIERKWICFNDANTLSFNMDTRVLSTGWWWATSKIDTLYEHPKQYANYLSSRRIEWNTVLIDWTLYPTVKKLSDLWINFTNEQEVKDLEIWLKNIKEWKKFSVWNANWNPFKISWRFKSFNNKLVFSAVNWDNEVFEEDISTKFPTIMRNQEKFLQFMNNPNNKMRWSALN